MIFRHRHSVGELNRIPGKGESIRERIPDDERGIRAEVSQMREYVRHFSGDPLVVQTARTVTQLCKAKDKSCEIQAIFTWAKDNYRFVNDPAEKEFLTTPAFQVAEIMTPPSVLREILGERLINEMMHTGKVDPAALDASREGRKRIVCKGCFEKKDGALSPRVSMDCDEAVCLIGSLLGAIGIIPRFRFGGRNDSRAMDGCNYYHVWLQGLDEMGKWVDMDLTEEASTLGWYFEGFDCTGVVPIF